MRTEDFGPYYESKKKMVEDEEKCLRGCRTSLKTPMFNNYTQWKHKLRENCYKRVREDRNRLLWKLRLPEVDGNGQCSGKKDFINSRLREIVSDELRKIKGTSLDETVATTCSNDSDDMIWEYDGVHTAYRGDCEEILIEMQRIFYEDLGRVEMEKLVAEPENSTTWEDEEDKYLARMVYDHMQLSNDQVREDVWCPICKTGKFQENHQHIYCSQCKLKLNRGLEVDLNFLRSRLAEAYVEHLDRGCMLRPEFCVENKFGITALYIKCEGCKTFDIVL